MKGEQLVTPDNRLQINNNTVLSILSINKIEMKDKGVYTCLALTNGDHSIKINYTLNVIESPPKDEPIIRHTSDFNDEDQSGTTSKTKSTDSKLNQNMIISLISLL